jgi:hypothetical protein
MSEFGINLCDWKVSFEPNVYKQFWMPSYWSPAGLFCGPNLLRTPSTSWKAVAPTPESLRVMGGNGSHGMGKTHIQTTGTFIRVNSPFKFTSQNDWTIAFAGAALWNPDGVNIVLGADRPSDCYQCRVEYYQNDNFKGGKHLLTIASEGDDPWELADHPLPLDAFQFHVLTLTHSNGLLRVPEYYPGRGTSVPRWCLA